MNEPKTKLESAFAGQRIWRVAESEVSGGRGSQGFASCSAGKGASPSSLPAAWNTCHPDLPPPGQQALCHTPGSYAGPPARGRISERIKTTSTGEVLHLHRGAENRGGSMTCSRPSSLFPSVMLEGKSPGFWAAGLHATLCQLRGG